MQNKTQLFDPKQTEGKTIKRWLRLFNECLVWFTDDTFLYFAAECYEDSTTTEFVIGEHFDPYDFDHKKLVESGFISAEELESLLDARTIKHQQEKEQEEREQYEKLKAKFEGK